MFGKKKLKEWYDVARKLHRKNKLEEPYLSLFEYMQELVFISPSFKNLSCSHYLYLCNQDIKGNLNNAHLMLSKILPLDLYQNFVSAVEKYPLLKYRHNGDEIDEFEDEDEYVYDHSDELIAIMKDYIDKIELQNNDKTKN